MNEKMTLEKICQLGLVFSGGEEEGGGDKGFVGSDGVFTDNWTDDEAFKENADTLSRFKDVKSLANSYMDIRKKVGKNPDTLVEIPRDDSSDEVKAAWRKAGGVPESLDGYEYTMPDEIGVKLEIDDNKMASFKEFAFKELELSPGKFVKLMDYYHKAQVSDIDSFDTSFNEKLKEDQEKATVELKKLWLGDYDNKVLRANAILRKYGGEDAVASFSAQNSPLMAQFLEKIAESMSEIQLKGLTGQTVPTTGDITTKINDIRTEMDKITKENPVNFKANSKYKELLERKRELYKQKSA